MSVVSPGFVTNKLAVTNWLRLNGYLKFDDEK